MIIFSVDHTQRSEVGVASAFDGKIDVEEHQRDGALVNPTANEDIRGSGAVTSEDSFHGKKDLVEATGNHTAPGSWTRRESASSATHLVNRTE